MVSLPNGQVLDGIYVRLTIHIDIFNYYLLVNSLLGFIADIKFQLFPEKIKQQLFLLDSV